MGHRRLSILDLSDRGRQPLISSDGQVVLSANGEIYNHLILRKQLEARHRFESHSDSEVLLHGYRQWGTQGLLERVEGMFAFVILDVERQNLMLARDRVGIKPLYYAAINGQFAWASELKAISAFFDGALSPNRTGVYDFLTYGYIPRPKTLYNDVFKLPPGCWLSIDILQPKLTSPQRYWSLRAPVVPESIDIHLAIDRTHELIRSSVGDQLMSDVPVGCFLSGGIDSSIVATEAARASNTLHTFTIGFAAGDRDETSIAATVAGRCGTTHHERILETPALEQWPLLLRSMFDEPFADTSAFPSHLVARLARENATVVLTGDGGDEIAGGYRWYRRFSDLTCRKSLPSGFRMGLSTAKSLVNGGPARWALTRLEQHAIRDPLELYASLLGGMLRDEKSNYRHEWDIPDDYDDYWFFREHYREDLPAVTRLQYLDFQTYLPEDILTKIDRATMAASLEARVPLLSTPLIEFMFSIPEQSRNFNDVPKGLWRETYATQLPAAVLNHPKQGFSLQGSARTFVQKSLKAPHTAHILSVAFPELSGESWPAIMNEF